MYQNKQRQFKMIADMSFIYDYKLKMLTQIFLTKKSYEICLPVHLILASPINFE